MLTTNIYSILIKINPIPTKLWRNFNHELMEQIFVQLYGWDLHELRKCPKTDTNSHKYYLTARRDFRWENISLLYLFILSFFYFIGFNFVNKLILLERLLKIYVQR